LNKTITISIRPETHQRLLSIGKMGQSFDEVISELVEKLLEGKNE